MSGTKSFVAGSVTLSGWVTDFTNFTHGFRIPVGDTGNNFDFNWSAPTTTELGGTDSPQVITGSGGDLASLTISFSDSNVTLRDGSDNVILNSGSILTLGGTAGESTSQLATDLQNIQIVDTGTNDNLIINFTLEDVTVGSSSDQSFQELFTTACYAPGTRIATPAGEVAVENLQIGDLVTSASGAARPVKWIGRRSHTAETAAASPNLRPVLIRMGALADGLPRRDLIVSPMHSMFIDDVLIPAVALVNGVSILRRETSGPVEYIHVELDAHDIILAEGAPAESFIDDDSRAIFANASEYYDLYGTGEPRRRFCAPRLEQGHRLEAIRRRLAARAGNIAAAAAPGELAGHVERIENGVLEGWVLDHADPATPVELEVLIDGERVATVLANRYRVDLDRAGLGGGRCGFTAALPAAASLARLEVRRIADAHPVPMPAPLPMRALADADA